LYAIQIEYLVSFAFDHLPWGIEKKLAQMKYALRDPISLQLNALIVPVA
jgi:hypothetical protein